jgi:hypothetical protein
VTDEREKFGLLVRYMWRRTRPSWCVLLHFDLFFHGTRQVKIIWGDVKSPLYFPTKGKNCYFHWNWEYSQLQCNNNALNSVVTLVTSVRTAFAPVVITLAARIFSCPV